MKNILVRDGKVVGVVDWEWAASASKEMERLAGIDFLASEEERLFFEQELEKRGVSHFFAPISPERKWMYDLISSAYSLVSYREWFQGKLLHTARLLDQKLYQRKIRNGKDIKEEEVLQEIANKLSLLLL